MLMIPRITNDPRHVTSAISQATKGGVSALPSRALECVMPWLNPRLSSGIQSLMARVAVGNVAPSPNPSRTRAAIIAVKVLTSPVSSVAPPHMIAEIVSARRAPNRSLTQPPMI